MLEMQPLPSVSSPSPFLFLHAPDIQQSSRKDRRDANLPLCSHLQAPDFNNGQEQYCKVRNHVDRASCDKYLFVIDAVARLRRRP